MKVEQLMLLTGVETLEDSKARYRSVLDSIYNNGNMAKDCYSFMIVGDCG